MKATFLNQYISDHTIRAICWTLIHSLWIGVIAAGLAGLVIVATKKATANLRYRLLCGILMLFVLVTGLTFFIELAKPVNTATVITLSSNVAGQTIITTTNAYVTIDGFDYTRAISFFDQYSTWIFAAWLLCFLLKSVKLTRELLYVKRVRSVGVLDIGTEWKEKVAILSQKLGMARAVRIKESKLINVPVTVGYLKPIILLPAGMILQLSPAQIESVIYHELAHILRRDYLVNIMQSVVETVFFFNPAIWWISALIREERETCCDDIVLAYVPQKRSYLEALMIFQEYETERSSYAMALSLRKNQLMKRLRRMVSHENQKLSAAEKVVLLSGMMLLFLFMFVPRANSQVRHSASFIKNRVMAMVSDIAPHVLPPPPADKKAHAHAPKLHIDTLKEPAAIGQLTDTLPKLVRVQFNKTNADSLNREVTVTDDANNHYYFKIENKKLVAFTINDVVIPPVEFSHYQPLLNRINQMIAKAHDDKHEHIKDGMQKLADYRARYLADLKAARDHKDDNVIQRSDDERAREHADREAARDRKDENRTQRDDERARERTKQKAARERKDADTVRKHTDKLHSFKVATKNKDIYAENYETGDKKTSYLKLTDGDTGRSLELESVHPKKKRNTGAAEKQESSTGDVKPQKNDGKPFLYSTEVAPKSTDIAPKKRHYTDISADQQRVRGVIAALVEEKVVSDATGIDWFGLSNDELIVNGTKQPEALHQKLKDQYGVKPNNGLYYGPVKMNGTGVFLDKKDL
jgi:beta-lactamase regulating signal transducer with metallopeptidase domain